MKKRLSLLLLPLLLCACSDQNQYEATVLTEMQQEKDLKDYKIDPQEMTTCVVDLTSKKMAGLFPFDPARMEAFQNYTSMLTISQAKDPKKTMIELSKRFGSPKALQEARINYTENVGNCLASLIMKSEAKVLEEVKAKAP
ncbi:MAG: hypothetical protein KAG10_09895 [Methylococcales bacterium]|nr:hypothetical protein [Methylococcales bacterium]MCK5926194.1 hypothetical protein [Methylococcales bacterium]